MNMDRIAAWLVGRVDPENAAKGPPPATLMAFMRWALRGCWGVIALAAFGFAMGGVFESLIMYMLGQIIDAVTIAHATGQGFWSANVMTFLSFALVLLILRPLFFAVATGFQSIAVMPNVFSQVMTRLNRHTLGQSIGFFDEDFAGRIAQKQMQTANSIVSVTQETINAMTFAVTAVLGMLVLSGAVDMGLLVIMVIWLGGYFGLLRYFLPRVRAKSAARAGARAGVTGQIVDTITNIKTVKLFAHDAHEDRAALDAVSIFRERAVDWASVAVLFRFFLIVLAGALPVAMMGYGLIRWGAGAVTAGELTAVGGMSIRLAQMTGWVSWTLMGIYGDIGEVEDGMRTLSPAHTLTDRRNAVELNVSDGAVHFDGLGFAYGRENGGVQALNLKIAAGEKIGIVGASGAGKSTLVSMLLRLYDPEQGKVMVDGQDIGQVTQASLRAQIGMVTQDTAMFNRSALDNIRYGRPDATLEDVRDAARQAEALEFIADLQDNNGRKGFDAYLGERGVKLSGGQRQRIALARAILKDAPILVLDEATSALDSEVEAAIQSALETVMQGKTVLAIAHRLSTISRMDRIVVMDRGQIAEIGTHADLLLQKGLYARYWERQSGGFIGTEDTEGDAIHG
ncbi:ABC transporter ATP-binding protein [Halocynthiibacter sp.]|uniref:ABC transporter ATP-binding protein n=1 Tax=Halocynthiibacter sp. TaxID=1979210 RepID=UPI003C6B10EC